MPVTITIADNLNSRALKSDSKKPHYDKTKIRVFSMRFCPFAHRGVIALALKGIPFEVVNLNLNSKPKWFAELNPLEKVPTYQLPDGRIIYESLIVAEWADETYPNSGVPLLPKDPFEKATQRMLVERMGKLTSSMFGFATEKMPAEEIQKDLAEVEKLLTEEYYGGTKPSWADYMMWPTFERIHAMSKLMGLDLSSHKKLVAYIEKMQENPVLKAYAKSPQHHVEYLKSMGAGKPNCDVGI